MYYLPTNRWQSPCPIVLSVTDADAPTPERQGDRHAAAILLAHKRLDVRPGGSIDDPIQIVLLGTSGTQSCHWDEGRIFRRRRRFHPAARVKAPGD